MKGAIQEEIVVIFHAALLGRTDVLKNAIASIRASCGAQNRAGLYVYI
jgi:hypothetical protein